MASRVLISRNRDGNVLCVTTSQIVDDRIQTIRSVVNPDKLRHLDPLGDIREVLGMPRPPSSAWAVRVSPALLSITRSKIWHHARHRSQRRGEGDAVRAMIVFYVLLAAVIGAFVVVQASINGDLRVLVGDPYRTALISTTVSTIFLFALSGVVVGRPAPDASTFTNAPWWMWVGGVLGAIYVAASSLLVSKLGSSVLFTLVILGQLTMAVVMDHFGWIGLEKHPVSAARILGIVLVLAGVVLVRKS